MWDKIIDDMVLRTIGKREYFQGAALDALGYGQRGCRPPFSCEEIFQKRHLIQGNAGEDGGMEPFVMPGIVFRVPGKADLILGL